MSALPLLASSHRHDIDEQHTLTPDAEEEDEDEQGRDEEHNALLKSPPQPVLVLSMAEQPSPTRGKLRAYWLGAVACMGGFLFGYDSGIIGGVLTLKSFESDFRYSSAASTRTQSLAVSLQQLGAFVACFLVWPVTHRIGRRRSLMISSFIFCVGALLQTINTHSLAAFYVGRIVAGLGLGSATVVVPMYSSEMSPKELRGRIGCFFQLMYTFGIFLSYWVDYGVETDLPTSSRQWQIPVGLQLIPGALLGFGMLTLKESVRWYAHHGRYDEAWASLVWIRASDSPAVQREMDEIRAGVELEKRETANFTFKELVEPHNFRLVSTSFGIFLAQQATGATAFAYYAPQYFKLLVGGGSQDLLLSGIFGAVKVVACGTYVTLFSERFGRRLSFIFGAALMAAILISTAAVLATHPAPPSSSSNAHTSASGKATVALIYLFVIVYNMTWGPLPWPYASEIFPTRIREPGIAIGVASQWLFNFVFTLSTPYMIDSIGWGTFLLWGLFNVVICLGSWLFLKETRGKSLEEITSEIFGTKDALRRKAGSEVSGGSPEGSERGLREESHARDGSARKIV